MSQYNSGVYCPPVGQHLWNIPVGFAEDEVMKRAIGRDGCYFKQITEGTGVSYIWHRRDTGVVEVWGPREYLDMAVQQIKFRIYMSICKMYNENRPLTDASINWMNDYYQNEIACWQNQNLY